MMLNKNLIPEVSIHICKTAEDFEIAKSITRDYIKWLGMDLCFQNIDKEFEDFESMYAKPKGCFIYAKVNQEVVGGVGCRRLEKEICEMKRLYVYGKFQGLGLGKRLCNEIITISKQLAYSKMRLDTVSKLASAIKLYEKIGFKYIPEYRENPDKTVRYMEISLI